MTTQETAGIPRTGRLLHYTHKPLESGYSVEQEGRRGPKPRGLWVSVEGEDDWRSWCEAESYGSIATADCYNVTLSRRAHLLRLETADAVLKFGKSFGCDPYFGRIPTMMSGHGIEWERVAAKYDGIIIAPYQWDLRYEDRVGWYYGWDCASGCIWNARAILAVAPVRENQFSSVQGLGQS